ncbi:hypothetical protein MLD38_018583 [Melastoma candidum]|uniref:Uncharacterized protein n=1 Tax=Melastoma candidum TaxID=119954 RepID=A0ACB9QU66_9MYRT|nr:hypothetical protein MLD38_018583 [Melastoma candidum]
MGTSGSGLASPLGTPTSSVDSSSDPHPPSVLDTKLSLGVGGFFASSSPASTSPAGGIHIPVIESVRTMKRYDWPPRMITGSFSEGGVRGPCLFVKVYMEGDLIGRKLDLLAHDGYDKLNTSLARMFKANIQSPGETMSVDHPNGPHVLTYEDKDGDWMMVGDVPWEMFKVTVKRMMIARAGKC